LLDHNRLAKCFAQYGLHIGHGLRGQTRAFPAAAGWEVAVEPRDAGRGDGLQAHVPDVRPDVAID
jgi:hypothetical protein